MPTREALRLAEEKGLDLVEISPNSRPPVCKIMDYGRFKYEEAKKKRQAKKKATVLELKEIKFRPKTDQHDLAFKTRHVRRFLEEGNKCRLVIIFRGREITHPQTGVAVLNKVVEKIKDIGIVDSPPVMEGRRMVMVVGPLGGVVRRAATKQRSTAGAKPGATSGASTGKAAASKAGTAPKKSVTTKSGSQPQPASGLASAEVKS